MAILSLFRCHLYPVFYKTWHLNGISIRTAVSVSYDVYGPQPSESKQHIIALHGLLGSKKNWKSLSTKISTSTKACVISADARNHGDSPHESTHSYLDLAADVSQLLQTLSLSQSHIIGHSMGGRTGMALALNEPTKVQSLIIVDISPIPRSPNPIDSAFPSLLAAMKNVNFEGADSGHKAKTIAKKSLVEAGFDERSLGFILMSIGERSDKTFAWKYNLDALANSFNEIAMFPDELKGKQYTGPTLFIGGGKSDYLRKSDEPAIKEFFPQSSLTYIEHVGHNAHFEDPSAFLKIVYDFYAKHL
ncbi:unnamed protein product [Arctia plantaginis]|uniref:sn-1-specific diacylglycerol lipase ABHD11 n=1 Tax=Arctia plantaginis TaxID=874455 RepID=A0A8S1BII4_ARCPL|nr:unnamed protein product [Arctia plantaginis]